VSAQEEALNCVADANDMHHVGQGHDGAGDQIPVIVELEWNHRLDVQDVLRTGVLGSAAVIEIVLEGHADKACDRVGQLLGQVCV
jgi:hypothetical protein